MIANCDAPHLPTRSIQSSKFGGFGPMQRFIAWSGKIMWPSSQNGDDSPIWKSWSDLLFLIERATNRATCTRFFDEKSIFLRRRSERELPLAGRFAISYRQKWKKLFGQKNSTWSDENNAGKFSQNLCRTRLKQKGGRHRRPGSSRDFYLHRFLRDLLRCVRAAAESHRERN